VGAAIEAEHSGVKEEKMRRVLGILGVMTIVGLSAGFLKAQEGPVAPGPAGGEACTCGCNGCGCDDCGCAERCSVCGRLKAYRASFGCFNCGCKGSYKYPVPPQYTYFWPGMYSQQTMTAYASPYRFPPLNLPPDMVPPPATPAKAPAKLGRVNQASYLQMPSMPVIDQYDRQR
jgi:hypothetical protein